MSKKGILLIGFIIFCVAIAVQFIFDLTSIGADDLRLVNTGHGLSYAVDANASFHSNNTRFFYFVTRTGVRYVNDRGETRWHETFNLTRPHMTARGDIVAIGEADRGRTVSVFNSSGLLYSETFNNSVLGFFINTEAYLSTIQQLDSGFEIQVHNHTRRFEHLFRKQIFQADRPMEIPVAVDVSNSGRYIAIAYLDLNRHLSTTVEFWFIDPSVAPIGTDGLFAGREFPDETFINMRFIADDHFLIITDSRITLYRIADNTLQDVWTENLYNRLDQLVFCGNRFAYVSGSATNPDGSYADPVGKVNIFDLSGRTGTFNMGRRATHLSMSNNSVIVGANRYFHALNAQGTSLWHHNATHDVRDMLFLNDTDTVLIAGPNRAYVWRRQRARGDAGEEIE